ncbi:hypothetical protein [Pukyongiella litopenaei]|uniref:Sulfotransferase family protein n=1 Tax=Pukyongiella litopenaei TaxID=2605946 RepID=A0A2S0MLT5_9RHOB|nr:hypothetical protein [Pukyongiella litopenaei]AVO36844.1 hypothetical protein C6Y53_03475 [Pukyongiella litopenaei]
MLRLVVHAGFHKTGTTTVQKTLRANAPVLKPHLRVFLRPRMVALCEAARAWSVSHGALDMALFRYELAELAQGWSRRDARPVLLASEDLAGHMPGRRGLTAYDATPALMKALAETVAQIHPGADIRFFFSTRAPAPWLASCHAQHLRAVRMVLDAETYADRYRASAGLDAVIDAVAQAVAPAPVLRRALEDSAGQALGPLAPLLDLCGLPDPVRDRLAPQPAANRRHDPAILLALLAANRDHADPDALRAAKRAILAHAQER